MNMVGQGRELANLIGIAVKVGQKVKESWPTWGGKLRPCKSQAIPHSLVPHRVAGWVGATETLERAALRSALSAP